jgi:hypothetical protein
VPAGAYAIWHAADAAEAVRFAAAELAAYLGRMTALELAVRPRARGSIRSNPSGCMASATSPSPPGS